MASQQRREPEQRPGHPQGGALFTRARLQDLVRSTIPGERMDPLVESALVKLAESFTLEVAGCAAELAAHRRSAALSTADIQLYLARNYNMAIPGFSDGHSRAAAAAAEPADDAAEQGEGTAANVHATSRILHPTLAHQSRAAHAVRASIQAASGHLAGAPPPAHHR